jgi:hypothetical protein
MVLLGGVLGNLFFFLVGIALLEVMRPGPELRDAVAMQQLSDVVGSLNLLTGFIGPYFWLLVGLGLKYTAIHEIKITNHSIALTAVSNEFVEMHRVQCRQDYLEVEERKNQTSPEKGTVTRAET